MLAWILGICLAVLYWAAIFGLYKGISRLNDFLINGR